MDPFESLRGLVTWREPVSGESFRFLHASDFHLENPLADLDDCPEHLTDLVVQAPRNAFELMVEAAIEEQVDFVILSGDLINPETAGPYGISLLLGGFERLKEAGKQVFWSGGLSDVSARWPDSIDLPDNVTVFSPTQTQVVSVQRAGRWICRVIGRSCSGDPVVRTQDYQVESSELFTIGVGYGEVTSETLTENRFNYWALGGLHQRRVFEQGNDCIAVYPGTPQGRSLSETGQHGFDVVDVDVNQKIRVQNQSADEFRYCRVTFNEQELAAVGCIENLIGERIYRLQGEHGSRHLLIAWEYEVEDARAMSELGDVNQILQWARKEYGQGIPCAWSISIQVQPPKSYPKTWSDEDTILGDFLRVATNYRVKENGLPNLTGMVEEHPEIRAGTAMRLAEVPPHRVSETLSQATRVGVELLRGGQSPGGNSR